MRIGLIGVGRIGAFHASTLRGLPGVCEVPGWGYQLPAGRVLAEMRGGQP